MEQTKAKDPGLILVRATVHLYGLPLGRTALVDPSEPYISECLSAQALVRVGDTPATGSP